MDYDPRVLRLYGKYLLTYAAAYTVVFAAMGGFMGFAAAVVVPAPVKDQAPLWALVGGLLLGAYGWLKAYSNKVEAHEMLCQVAIEEHLRALRGGRSLPLTEEDQSQSNGD